MGQEPLEKFVSTMEELEKYLGATYSDICQTFIMNKITETFQYSETPTIIPGMGGERPKIDAEMTYPMLYVHILLIWR